MKKLTIILAVLLSSFLIQAQSYESYKKQLEINNKTETNIEIQKSAEELAEEKKYKSAKKELLLDLLSIRKNLSKQEFDANIYFYNTNELTIQDLKKLNIFYDSRICYYNKKKNTKEFDKYMLKYLLLRYYVPKSGTINMEYVNTVSYYFKLQIDTYMPED